MSDTPRSARIWAEYIRGNNSPGYFRNKLDEFERELAAMAKERDSLKEENEALKVRHEAAVFSDDSEIMQLRAENERLVKALDQATKHAMFQLPDKYHKQYDERITHNHVMFTGGDECEYKQVCPELAAYLRAKEGNHE